MEYGMLNPSQNFFLTAYGTYTTHGTYGTYETYESHRSHKSHFGDSQNPDSRPIWRRPPTSKRFAGDVGALRTMSSLISSVTTYF